MDQVPLSQWSQLELVVLSCLKLDFEYLQGLRQPFWATYLQNRNNSAVEERFYWDVWIPWELGVDVIGSHCWGHCPAEESPRQVSTDTADVFVLPGNEPCHLMPSLSHNFPKSSVCVLRS